MPKKLTYEHVKSQIEKEGYKLLSIEYKSSIAKLKIVCPKDHIYKVRYNDFKAGKRCPECHRLSILLTIDIIKDNIKIIAPGYKLLSTKYINSINKLKFKCPNNHIYSVKWSSFQQGHRCVECAGLKRKTVKEVETYLKSFNYKLLSTKYINSTSDIKVQCPYGHTYITTWTKFRVGHRCNYCNNNTKKKTYYDIKKYIESYNYKLLSTKYKNSKTKLIIKCNKNHTYKVSWHSFHSGSRCPVCRNLSRFGKGNPNWKNYTNEELKNYNIYRERIRQLSNNNYNKYHVLINPNKYNRSLLEYHLDHIYTVYDGFNNNINSEVISNPYNLQMLWYSNNIKKGSSSEQSKKDLFLGYYKYKLN